MSEAPKPATVAEVMAQLAESEKANAEPQLTSRQRRARTVARLAAVQALYQMELVGEPAEKVVREFRNFRFDGDIVSQPPRPLGMGQRLQQPLDSLEFAYSINCGHREPQRRAPRSRIWPRRRRRRPWPAQRTRR